MKINATQILKPVPERRNEESPIASRSESPKSPDTFKTESDQDKHKFHLVFPTKVDARQGSLRLLQRKAKIEPIVVSRRFDHQDEDLSTVRHPTTRSPRPLETS